MGYGFEITHRPRAALAAVVIFGGLCMPIHAKEKPARCWDQNSIFQNAENGAARSPHFTVLRLAAFPKRIPDPSYAYHPVSIAFRQPNPTFFDGPAHMDGVAKYALMWGNRCHVTAASSQEDCVGWGVKAVRLTINRTEYDVFFTSVAKADACTRAQVLATVGASLPAIKAPLAENGVVFATNEAPLSEAAAQLATIEQRRAWAGANYEKYAAAKALNKGAWAANVCYVPEAAGGPLEGISSHIAGIVFDWEVADKRTPKQTAAFMKGIAREIRAANPAFKVFLLNNPIHAAGKFGGVTPESGPQLLDALDGVEIFIHESSTPVAEQLDEQMRMFGGGVMPRDVSKFIVGYDLTKKTDVAMEARSVLLQRGFKYVMLGQAWVADKHCDVTNFSSPVNRQVQELLGLPQVDANP